MIADYLIAFFAELDRLQRSGNHAVTYRGGLIQVLVGMGDMRVRVPVGTLDPHPAKAAENVIDKWQSMPDREKESAMEECR